MEHQVVLRKKIFSVDGSLAWNKSHSQLPVVINIKDSIFRIFYSTRDSQQKSRPSFFDYDVSNDIVVNENKKGPLLELGPPGSFDDSGVMPTEIVKLKNKYYMYYIGWSIKKNVDYHNSIGLAVSNDCTNFKKLFDGPIIAQSKFDPIFCGTMGIFKSKGKLHGYYLSALGWLGDGDILEPSYNLKYVNSTDGINWKNNKTAVDLIEDEGGLASARVIKLDNTYLMAFSARKKFDFRKNKKNSYRIKFATSNNLVDWEREKKIELTLPSNKEEFDSEMMAYPYLIKYKKTIYFFYNGNDFGKTGIGIMKVILGK